MKTRINKKLISLLLVLAMICAVVTMPESASTSLAAKKATLKTKKITINVGQKKTIKLKNKKKGAKYSFKVKKKSVATVSSKGVVTAKKAGTTKVTVKEKIKKKSRTVGNVSIVVKKANKPAVTPTPAPQVPTTTPPVATATPAPTATPFVITDEIYATMVTDSVLSTGNNARIKRVIEKARAGEDVTLAYIGGSITEGAKASPNSNCYAETSAKAFAAKYGKDGGENVHFINAGMSGTPSSLGIIRYDRDVLGRITTGDHPDILFIEFAVNDFNECTNGGGYEGLIRKALESGSAVFLVFSIFQSGRVMESSYIPYGTHYDLPMVSMGDATNKYFRKKNFFKWYFGDVYHPNNAGHKLMSDCIMETLDRIDKEDADVENEIPQPKKTADYVNTKFLSRESEVSGAITELDAGGFSGTDTQTSNFQYEYKGQEKAPWFPQNWMHTATSGSDSFKATVNCKVLLVAYKLSSSTTTGSVDLYVDGQKVKTLSGYDKNGWNNPSTELVFANDNSASHTIEVKMASGSESKEFTLLGFGYAN